jgi:hypothetical protein
MLAIMTTATRREVKLEESIDSSRKGAGRAIQQRGNNWLGARPTYRRVKANYAGVVIKSAIGHQR